VKLLQAIFIYAILTMLALFMAACIWEHQVTGILYRCADSVPILDFIPPFVHSKGHTGDVYLVPEAQVYRTWYAYLAVCFVIPAVPLLVLLGLHWSRWRKEENG